MAHRLDRLLNDMPLTHNSAGSVLVGTICPPGHMQKSNTRDRWVRTAVRRVRARAEGPTH